jgi:predicted dehydrogenase
LAVSILQIGCGAFGPVHLGAWRALGRAADLTVADPRPDAARAVGAVCPEARVVADWRTALADADVVDILTPSDTHHAIAKAALTAGKDVFIEKPVTVTTAEALDLTQLAETERRVVQCGLYFRFHPKAQGLRAAIAAGEFGRLRHLGGRFLGLKRARADSGALHNDAVHFIDLLTWLAGERPRIVYAVTRDHFGRGMDDLAVLHLTYPSGTAALIETGYIQPGRWPDAVTPGAVTSKEIAIAGERAVAEIDFAAEVTRLQRGAHRPVDGIWRPDYGPIEDPGWPAADPVAVVTAELAHFLDCVATRRAPAAGLRDCGIVPAAVIEAAIASSRDNRVVEIAYPM